MTADNRHGSTKQSDEGQRERRRASERSEEYRFAENLPAGEGTVAEREYDDYALAASDSDSEDPDVLLDVPVVKVDEINLNVDQLRARVSLQAEVLDLLRLNVGADVFIDHVGLEIKGVEAQALLKVRLDNVARILDRVLTTIDRNPQILEQIAAGVGSAVDEVGGGAGRAVGELGEGAGAAVEDVGAGAGSAVEDVGEGAGSAVEDVGEGAGSAVEDVGEGAGSAVEDVGGAVEDVGEGAGSAVEDVGEGAGSAVEDTGETAKRTAQGAGKTVRQTAGRTGKPVKKAKRAAQKDSEGRTSRRSEATGQRRRVKRSEGQSSRRTRASDDSSS